MWKYSSKNLCSKCAELQSTTKNWRHIWNVEIPSQWQDDSWLVTWSGGESQRLLGYQLLFQNAIKRQTNNRAEGFHRGGVFSLHAVTYKWKTLLPCAAPDNTVCQPHDLRPGLLSYHSLFWMHGGNATEWNRSEGEEGGRAPPQYDQLTGRVCLVRQLWDHCSVFCFEKRSGDLSAGCTRRTAVAHAKAIYRQNKRRLFPLNGQYWAKLKKCSKIILYK